MRRHIFKILSSMMLMGVLFLSTQAFAQQSANTNSQVNTAAQSATRSQASGGSVVLYSTSPGKQTITTRNTPDVYAPSIVGGDICTVGMSAGGSGPGIGISIGFQRIDHNCEIRQDAALLFNMHEQQASIAMLCEDDGMKTALNRSGVSCPGETPIAAPAAPLVSYNRPIATPVKPIVRQQPVATTQVAASSPVCHWVVKEPMFPNGKVNPNGAAYAVHVCSNAPTS